MTDLDDATRDSAGRAHGERWLPVLLLLFVGSGCAALMYEVVWLQLLELSIGSSAVSLGVLLGVFMGGMCLGSLLLPKCIGRRAHPLRVYAWLELGIGLFGIVVTFAVPIAGRAYSAIAGTGPLSLGLRAVVVSICLIPPTLLMGATLPAIARWVETTPRGIAWLGYFYGGNLAGAVTGSLLAGFYLLRVYDMPTTTFVAVGLNVAVALLALAVARRTPRTGMSHADDGAAPLVTAAGAGTAYIAIALSGLTALGSQVLWTRMLSLMFGATAYTFSLILAVFLVGLGIGSTLGSALARSVARPRMALGWCQVGLCACMAWAAYAIGASLPYWPVNPLISTSPVFTFQLDLMRAAWVMLPGAILWGASFPLALASIAARGQDPARLVGRVYAANTAGAIAGALVTSLLLVGTIGSQLAQQVLIGIAALSGLLMLLPAEGTVRGPIASVPVLTIGVAVIAGLLARAVPPVPGLLVAYGRFSALWVGETDIIFVGEGVTASVAVSRTPTGELSYHNSGKVQASSEPADMRAQRMLGHITTLVPQTPGKVLVIGCGAGVTAGAVSIDPMVREETIAEIEPLVPRVASTYFAAQNFDVITNPKVTLHLDDARHYLLTTDETFDAITSDPLDPWFKGAATLWTREFFQLVKARLNPGGVVTLWVQLFEMDEAAVKSELATFFEAFPDGAVFANTIAGRGYDLVLVGQVDKGTIDVDAVEARLADPANSRIAQSLQQIGIVSAVDLFGTYAGRRADMQRWLSDAIINTDRNLKLQYLAGLGLNRYESDAIFRSMTRDSTYPEDLFEGSVETLQALEQRIDQSLGGTPDR